MQITIQLFGAMRKFADGKMLQLEVPTGTRVGMLREILVSELCKVQAGEHNLDAELIHSCAFGSESEILSDEELLQEKHARLAILPPVCGG